MKQSGRNPALFKRIIITAIYAWELLINRIMKNARAEADKVVDTVTEAKPEWKDYREVFKVKGSKEPAKEAVPEMPGKSVLAFKFHRLTDIYYKLEKQNEVIYEREQQLGSLEKELANAKGIFKGKQQTDNKVESDSIQARLQRKQQEVKERENNRQSYHRIDDRGGR